MLSKVSISDPSLHLCTSAVRAQCLPGLQQQALCAGLGLSHSFWDLFINIFTALCFFEDSPGRSCAYWFIITICLILALWRRSYICLLSAREREREKEIEHCLSLSPFLSLNQRTTGGAEPRRRDCNAISERL